MKIRQRNQCRFCGKELLGLSPCNCVEKIENQKLWQKGKRRGDKDVTK